MRSSWIKSAASPNSQLSFHSFATPSNTTRLNWIRDAAKGARVYQNLTTNESVQATQESLFRF